MMLNWRSVETDGYPIDGNKSYLVTDGKDMSTTDVSITKNYSTGETKFNKWAGDESTYEDNQCCSGERMFDMIPTHWCPTGEIQMP
jgi:hypothetical protein